jgi:hypothetical protein
MCYKTKDTHITYTRHQQINKQQSPVNVQVSLMYTALCAKNKIEGLENPTSTILLFGVIVITALVASRFTPLSHRHPCAVTRTHIIYK